MSTDHVEFQDQEPPVFSETSSEDFLAPSPTPSLLPGPLASHTSCPKSPPRELVEACISILPGEEFRDYGEYQRAFRIKPTFI